MKSVVLFSLVAGAALATSPSLAQPAPQKPEPAPMTPDADPASGGVPEGKAEGSAGGSLEASAPVLAPVPARDRAAPEGPPRYDLVRVNAGVRVGYLPSRGFDAYSPNDVLEQFSIDGTYPLLRRGSLVLGAGLGWDFGASSDRVRGFESSVTAHRLYVPLEARWHPSPWVFAFGKLSPGAAAVIASVKESSSPGELSGTGWAFSADASVGASILMGPRNKLDKRGVVRFWLTPEVGYAYTTNASLAVNAGRDEKELLGTDEDTRLRSLALSGLFWRASIGATF
mgnify:CR=1 FL=1